MAFLLKNKHDRNQNRWIIEDHGTNPLSVSETTGALMFPTRMNINKAPVHKGKDWIKRIPSDLDQKFVNQHCYLSSMSVHWGVVVWSKWYRFSRHDVSVFAVAFILISLKIVDELCFKFQIGVILGKKKSINVYP